MRGLSSDSRRCGPGAADCAWAEKPAWNDDRAWKRACDADEYGNEHFGKYGAFSADYDVFTVLFLYWIGDFCKLYFGLNCAERVPV